TNRHLLTEDKRSRHCGATAWRLTLDVLMRFEDRSFHHLLKRFLQRLCWHIEKEGMELFGNVSTDNADGCVACHLSKLMPAHAVGNDIQTKRHAFGAARDGRRQRQDAIFIV